MFKIKRLDHLVIRTQNIKEMISFYCFVLGYKMQRDNLKESGLIELNAGESMIDLFDISNSNLNNDKKLECDKDIKNLDHFCILLDEFDETEIKVHLKSFGVDFGDIEMNYGSSGYGPSLYIFDPDGNKIELKGVVNHNNDN